jgi:cytochrome c
MNTASSKPRSIHEMAARLAAGAAVAVLMHAVPAHADAALGKTQFAACAACHSASGSDGIGPHLNGVLGRKAGSVAGFSYSQAMSQSRIVWNPQNLAAYLADPQKVVPGNKMPFAGMQDPTEVANIVDYLKSLH